MPQEVKPQPINLAITMSNPPTQNSHYLSNLSRDTFSLSYLQNFNEIQQSVTEECFQTVIDTIAKGQTDRWKQIITTKFLPWHYNKRQLQRIFVENFIKHTVSVASLNLKELSSITFNLQNLKWTGFPKLSIH